MDDIDTLITAVARERLLNWTKQVQTRRGAAAWVRNKLISRTENPGQSPDAPLFSAADIAREAAPIFARRGTVPFSNGTVMNHPPHALLIVSRSSSDYPRTRRRENTPRST